ncbi:MAG: hypothetical protein ACTSSL_10260 [Candidatus Heimdallarchaeaceae archaeon]
MCELVYVTLAGSSRKAIVNSIYFTVKEFIKKNIKSVEKLSILKIKSNTSPIKKESIKTSITENFSLSKELSDIKIVFFEEKVVPEHMLIDIFKEIQNELVPFLDNNQNKPIIVELEKERKQQCFCVLLLT